TGEFGKAFQSLLSRASVEEDVSLKWRHALDEASGLAGFVVLKSRHQQMLN
ncbi:TIR-NBS-LRR RCT1 resistance protein, partial [Trifolium medium]|nr:TIR-NBS-LRR RCT1 resistance protein [Trifolium medium]